MIRHNLAADKETGYHFYDDILNKIIKDEIGVYDGSFIPDTASEPWDLTIEQFNRMEKD